jgi:predicted acetyltransferase
MRIDWSDPSSKMNKLENVHVEIEIIPASLAQKRILANLLELYSHDFSEFTDLEISLDGRFGYRELDLYWSDPDRLPFLLYVTNRLAGFALIKAYHRDGLDETVWDMTEFFILRGYRGRGIGTAAAHQVWKRFPGRWQVRVMATNEPAYRFWHHAVKSFAGDDFLVTDYQQAGKDWHRLSFESKLKAGQPGLAAGPAK